MGQNLRPSPSKEAKYFGGVFEEQRLWQAELERREEKKVGGRERT